MEKWCFNHKLYCIFTTEDVLDILFLSWNVNLLFGGEKYHSERP